MASLRKHKKSPHWIGCFTKPNRKRTSRSTEILIAAPTPAERKEQRDRALAMVLEWELTGLKAKREGMTQDKAIEIVNDILRSAGAEEIGEVTTRSFFTDWIKGKVTEGTRERYGHAATSFLCHIGVLADQSIRKVRYQEILGFMQMRTDSGVAPKTIKVDVKAISSAFNLALKLDHIKTNPAVQALALQPITAESMTKGVFSPAQIQLLIGAAEGDWLTTIYLGYYTAARLRDCTNFKVKQIDWVNGMIPLKQGKTGKPAWIPIHPCLARHLRKVVAGLSPDDYVCPTLANRRTGGKTGLSKEFSKIMKKANIDPGLVPGMGKKRFSLLSFHSLRHSFNSHLANAGVAQETRQIMTGHGTKAANDDYTHLDLPKLRAAIILLPDVDSAATPATNPAPSAA